MRDQLGISILAFAAISVAGCTYSSSTLDPITCDDEGAQQMGRECRGGLWVTLDGPALEMGPPDMSGDMILPDLSEEMGLLDMPDTPDMPSDMCTPESAAALCANRCGMYEAVNSCGSAVRIECGQCSMGECVDNMCVVAMCEDFTPEAGVEICAAHECGTVVTPATYCADTAPPSIDCGMCAGADEVCNQMADVNTCCAPESVIDFCFTNQKFCTSFTGIDRCGQTRSVDCGDYCFHTETDLTDGGPYVRPAASGTAPFGSATSLFLWFDANRGFEVMPSPADSTWANNNADAGMMSVPANGIINDSAMVSIQPAASNGNDLVSLSADGFIEIDLPNDRDNMVFVMTFRTSFTSPIDSMLPWYEQAALLGADSLEAGNADFSLVMNSAGDLIWGHDGMDADVATGAAMLNDGRMHILYVSRRANGKLTVFVDGVKVHSGTIDVFDGALSAVTTLRIGAQTPDPGNMLRGGWEGEVGDVLMYDSFGSAEIARNAFTALALKHGRTFDSSVQEYYLSENFASPAYNLENPAHAFVHRITALFRDDASAFHQARSRSEEDGSILTLRAGDEVGGAAGLSNDLSSVAIADNGAPTTLTSKTFDVPNTRGVPDPADFEVTAMERAWRMELENMANEPFNINFAPGDLPAEVNAVLVTTSNDISANPEIFLIRDVNTARGMVRGATLTFADDDTRYFTFGQIALKQ